MATVRISPGIYEVNGKRVTAKTSAEAEKMAGKQAGKGDAKSKAKTPIQQAGNFTDPSKVAGAELALNRVNETNPFGSRTFDPATGAVTDTLSEGQQGLLNAQTGTGTLGSNVASGLLGGLQGQGAYDAQSLNRYMPQGSDQARQATYDATYGQLTKDLAANKGRDQAALEQRLADQGIPVGSKLYNDQMQQFNTRYDDQELAARNQATLSGNQAFEQSFNQGQTNYQNQLGAYNSNYSMPASIAGQLQGLGQVYQPQFGQGIAAMDLGGYYSTATAAKLANKQGGARAPAAPTPNYPTMGGVAGAGVATQQPQRPGVAGTLGNAVVQGITTGAANQFLK